MHAANLTNESIGPEKRYCFAKRNNAFCSFFMPGVTEDIRPIMKIVFFVDSINV